MLGHAKEKHHRMLGGGQPGPANWLLPSRRDWERGASPFDDHISKVWFLHPGERLLGGRGYISKGQERGFTFTSFLR